MPLATDLVTGINGSLAPRLLCMKLEITVDLFAVFSQKSDYMHHVDICGLCTGHVHCTTCTLFP